MATPFLEHKWATWVQDSKEIINAHYHQLLLLLCGTGVSEDVQIDTRGNINFPQICDILISSAPSLKHHIGRKELHLFDNLILLEDRRVAGLTDCLPD